MIDERTRFGTCLCKSVRVSVGFFEADIGACHCTICRKWSGGPLFEVECGSNVVFEGAENIGTYESSDWAQRGFCRSCGTHLFIKNTSNGEYGIPPGIFENEEGFKFNRQVFIDQKPSYYAFTEHTENITSAYIYEHFPETRKNI